MRKILFLSTLSLFLSCPKDSGFPGRVISTDMGQNVVLTQALTVSVINQGSQTFPVSFVQTQTPSTVLDFTIKNLEKGQNYVFELVQPSILETVLSFPMDIGQKNSIDLAAVPSGTFFTLGQNAILTGKISNVISGRGHVMGQLSPLTQGCSPYTSVSIVDASEAAVASTVLYLDNNGAFVESGFSDVPCTFIIYNLVPGNYTLNFAGSSTPKKVSVFVVADQVSFGINPTQ